MLGHACALSIWPAQTFDTTNTETCQQETQSKMNFKPISSLQLMHTSADTPLAQHKSQGKQRIPPEAQNVNNRHQTSQDSLVVPHSVNRESRHYYIKLNIPVYPRDLLNWLSFWDCFEAAIHCNCSLTGGQLVTCLTGACIKSCSTVHSLL